MRLLLRDIKLYYLSDLALQIDYFESDCPIGIYGFSGSGKSNFIKVIAGLEIIKEGQILINGEEITYLKPKKRNMSLISKHTGLFNNKSVYYNLTYPLKKLGLGITIPKDFSLQLDKKAKDLSEREKIDLLIDRAKIKNPQLVLIDEPYEICSDVQYFIDKIKPIREKLIITSFDKDLIKEIALNPIKAGEFYGQK